MAVRTYVPIMSYLHHNEFERIKREHEEVVALLSALAEKSRKAKTGQKDKLAGLPSFDATRIESAIAAIRGRSASYPSSAPRAK